MFDNQFDLLSTSTQKGVRISNKEAYFNEILVLGPKFVDIHIFSRRYMTESIDFHHLMRIFMLPNLVAAFDLCRNPILASEEAGYMVLL